MAMIKKILVPSDFSDLSATGVRYACRLAGEIGAELILINIVPLDESNFVDKTELNQHKQRLDELANKVIVETGADIKLRKIVEPGPPAAVLIETAEKERVDLLVMSSHGRTGIARILMGSVTEEVLRHSPCPVLVVPLAREK